MAIFTDAFTINKRWGFEGMVFSSLIFFICLFAISAHCVLHLSKDVTQHDFTIG